MAFVTLYDADATLTLPRYVTPAAAARLFLRCCYFAAAADAHACRHAASHARGAADVDLGARLMLYDAYASLMSFHYCRRFSRLPCRQRGRPRYRPIAVVSPFIDAVTRYASMKRAQYAARAASDSFTCRFRFAAILLCLMLMPRGTRSARDVVLRAAARYAFPLIAPCHAMRAGYFERVHFR